MGPPVTPDYARVSGMQHGRFTRTLYETERKVKVACDAETQGHAYAKHKSGHFHMIVRGDESIRSSDAIIEWLKLKPEVDQVIVEQAAEEVAASKKADPEEEAAK